MNNKMVLNIMIAYFVILSIVLVFQLTKLNDKDLSAPSNSDVVLAEDRLNNAVVFYNDSPVVLANKSQKLLDRNNPDYTPVIKNNVAYLPTSFFSTVYGANVSSDKSKVSVTIRLNNKALVMSADETTLVDNSNEKEIKAETKPVIEKNTVYVPADVFAEAFDKSVYLYGSMGIISDAEFTSADNSYLDSIVSQVNDLPYVFNQSNLKSVANVSATDDVINSIERKIKAFENENDKTSVNALNAVEDNLLLNDSNYIYYGATNKVEILANSAETKKIAEISLPEKFNTKKIILNSGNLIVVGNLTNDVVSNSQLDETTTTTSSDEQSVDDSNYMGNVSTCVYIYNISDIANIKAIKSYCVSGYYQNVEISSGYMYLLSRNTVYGLYANNKFNPPAYKEDNNATTKIEFDTIQYFPEVNSDDITVLSAINISDISANASVKAFLGAGNNTYLSKGYLYIPKARNTAFGKYEKVENSCIYRYTLSNGNITASGKANIFGNLINTTAISEKNGYCMVVTKFTDSEHDNKKVSNVYVLNNNFVVCGQASKVANEDDISSAIFCDNEIILVPEVAGGNMYAINIENPTMPQGRGKLKLSDGNIALYLYDDNTFVCLDNGGGVLKLALYDFTDFKNPSVLYSQELGRSDIINSPLFNSDNGFLFDKEKNIMVVPVSITGESTFEGEYVYSVFKDEGFNRLGNVTLDNIRANAVAKGKLLTFNNDKVVSSDLTDIQKQTIVEFEPQTETTTVNK